MKSQVKLAVGGGLLLQRLRAVLAHHADAAPHSAGRSSASRYLTAASTVIDGSGSCARASRRGCAAPRSGSSPATRPPPGGPVDAARATVREEALVADRAEPDVLHVGDARRAQPLGGRGLQVDVATGRVTDRARGPRRRPRSSSAPAPGPIAACSSPRAPSPRSVATPRLEDPAGEPAPAGVQHRHAVAGAQRDRQAVGDEHDRARRRASRVAWPSASSSRSRRRRLAQRVDAVPWTCRAQAKSWRATPAPASRS